jgi:hypothetical protein
MPTKPNALPTATAAQRCDFAPQPDPPPAAEVRFLLRMKDVPEKFRCVTDAEALAVLAPVRRAR